jgi:hypothetical protein
MMQTKAQADEAYRQSLVVKTQYTSATPPATKPDYVPNDIQVSGHPVHVTYNHYSSGGYGYGYYDPTSHLFVTLAATHMILNAQREAELDHMYNQQIAAQQYQQQEQPQIVQQPIQKDEEHGFVFYFLWFCAVIAIIAIVALIMRNL